MIRRLAPATLGVLVLLLACTDFIGPRGGNSVRLVVQPSFGQVPATAAADNPASRVDNVHVVLLNAGGTTVLDTVVEWPLDQDTLRMEMDVVVQERETFELTIQGRSGDRVLFMAGPMSLELSDDDGGSTVATSPVLEYAGPGAEVVAVEITGAPGSFVAGSAVGLGAVGTNDDGSDAGDLIIVWTSLDPEAATVGEDGSVQVRHDASRAVSIEARVAFTTLTDTIGGPILPSELVLSPDTSTLTALGAELSLTAELLGEDGGDVTGVPIEWAVVDPSVLELTGGGDEGGAAVATALTRGTTRVIATAGELTDSANVTVEQTVVRLEVDPDTAALARVGTTLQATASAFDANDNEVEDTSVEWSSGAPEIATVAEDGAITAVSPGTAWITASSDETADSLLATVANAAPELTITAPSDGAVVEEGDTITFEGAAEDLEDGDLSAAIEWVSDNPGELGTGASVAAELEPGDHTVTATVVDAHGDTASAAIVVTVNSNTAPTVSITAPSAGTRVSYRTEVTLEGAADDEQDGDLSSSIVWSSDLDGSLGSGASVQATKLTVGAHTITAAVTDSHGETATASIRVDVALPNLVIGEMTIEASEPLGSDDTVRITVEILNDGGAASDSTDAVLRALDSETEAVLAERSVAVPALDTGESVVRVLEVTFEAEDLVGDSLFFEIELDPDDTVAESDETDNVVRSPSFAAEGDNTAPVVTILTPEPGTTMAHGTAVEFTGTAEDAQDGDLSASIIWFSSVDGELGAGGSITVSDLSEGAHDIDAIVTDSRDATGGARIGLLVEPSGFTLGGSVLYAGSGIQDVAVDLIDGGDPEGTAAETTQTDSDGAFAFAGLASGTYTVRVNGPDGFVATSAQTVQIQDGDVSIVIDLPKKIALAAPDDGSIVSVPPTLEWNAINEADNYTVQLDTESGSLVNRITGIETTSYTVVETLIEEESYTWQVNAYDSDGHHVGSTEQLFTFLFATAPSVSIIDPDTSVSYVFGSQVTYEAGVDEPGDEDLSVEWTVSSDPLIFGDSLRAHLQTHLLSLGTHQVEVKVTNLRTGLHGTATGQLKVTSPGLTIDVPADSAVLDQVSDTFIANLKNGPTGDGVYIPATRWSYNSGSGDVAFDQSGSAVTQLLPVGSHTITAKIGNAKGEIPTDQIEVTVNPVLSGAGTAKIDGTRSADEWTKGACVDFDAAIPSGSVPAELCVMNDGTNVYVLVEAQTTDPNFKQVAVELDADGDNIVELDPGDDEFMVSGTDSSGTAFLDRHIADDGSIVWDDLLELGLGNNGAGAFLVGDGTTIFELSHPLTTSDTGYDIDLDAGDTTRIMVRLRLGPSSNTNELTTLPGNTPAGYSLVTTKP